MYARITAAAEEGRLPTPAMAAWDVFPWQAEGDAVVPKPLAAPVAEKPRLGEPGGDACGACDGFGFAQIVWEDEHWVLTTHTEPTGLPMTLTLWTREHLDIGDFGDEHASELGRIANRLVRIMEAMPGIGRVHVNRWGDGSSHAHVWFFARPEGFAQIRGTYAVEWSDILPPVPEDVWRADLHAVATKLANWGGHARV